ncbi:methyl-accepting chemotaxis protein [Gordoniibacillus kamchatkensis]|uniref:methyl-accepting chemotaxis protein n=1 Tax=Gordoniibacillus kamchatkensis TaxID=1590651 RepID=UPI000698C8E7|nr:methyl-accepting chemotaxis protein [Paenibacillus sp. VKM B-2647]
MNVASLRNRVTMRMRLLASFAIVLAIFVGAAAVNLNQMNQIKRQIAAADGKVGLKLTALELKELVQEMNIIAAGLEISKKPEYIDKYNEKRKQFSDMVKAIGDTATTDDQRLWRSKLISASNDYIANFDTAARLIREGNLKQADLDNNMVYLYGESQKLMGEIFGIVDQFYNVYSLQANDATRHTYDLLGRSSAMMVAAACIVLVVTLVVAAQLNRSFMGPIRRLQQAVSRIAAGDLRHKIEARERDELGLLSDSFDRMIDQVRTMLSHTQAVASSLSAHSDSLYRLTQTTAAANGDIVQAIGEISHGAGQQAAQAEQSFSIIAELDGEFAEIAEYAGRMQRSSREASHRTKRGTDAVQALQTAAREAQHVVGRASTELESLVASSADIGAISRAITDISAQTHVLALNAAIEAARAGANGRGFSVIAEEVRLLAEQTNGASKSIGRIIASLQQQLQGLHTAMRTALEAAAAQSVQADETSVSFEEISASMEQVNAHIGHVHDKIELAKANNATLVATVRQVAAIAVQTAASVEEVDAAVAEQDASVRSIAGQSEQIRTSAQRLFTEISKFRIADEAPDALAAGEEPELSAAGEVSGLLAAGEAEKLGAAFPDKLLKTSEADVTSGAGADEHESGKAVVSVEG